MAIAKHPQEKAAQFLRRDALIKDFVSECVERICMFPGNPPVFL